MKLKTLAYLIILCCLAMFGCDDDAGSSSTGGNADAGMSGATISYTGVASQWLSGDSGAEFTVCVYETENCTTTDAEGNFTLVDVAADAELIFTFVSADDARLAFPVATGAEDVVNTRPFTVVNRAIAELMVASVPGEENGIDNAKSILTFYAGIGGLPVGRGLAGVSVNYDGPDTDKSPSFIIPTAGDPGVAVGAPEITETSTAGNGFIPNIEPGDYTITFSAADRNCSPLFAWPAAEGSEPNTFRTRLIEGYATFTFVTCATDLTVDATAVINDFGTPLTPLADAEVCISAADAEEGAEANCVTTDAEGNVAHSGLPGDTQLLATINKADYMPVNVTLEALTADFEWTAIAPSEVGVIAAAATAGLSVEDDKGHVSIFVINEAQEFLEGFALELVGSDADAAYFGDTLIDPELTVTSAAGVGGFFNVEPGSYNLTVTKEGIRCIASPFSWANGGGYTVPVEAGTFTEVAVVCLDEAPPLFGAPSEAVDAPACGDDAEVNCDEVCDFFYACAEDLCPGNNDSEWAAKARFEGGYAACKATCENLPALIDVSCGYTECNEILTLAVNQNEAFNNACYNGLSTILETATAAAAAEDSTVTTAFDLVTASPAILEALGGEGPLTVFIPVNDAFAALDPALVELVLADEALRTSILSYHAVATGLSALDVVGAIEGGTTSIDTLGGSVSLAQDAEGNVLVGGATVIATDAFASNGVIHLIDGVILPEYAEPAEAVAAPMCVADDAAASCAEACRQFVECGLGACPGLTDANAWITTISSAGMQDGCETACADAPALINVACTSQSCGQTLALVTLTQDGFGDFCNDGWDNLIEVATEAAEAEDSNVGTVFGLIAETPAVIDALSAEGPFTVFLPVDDAFGALDAELLQTVMADEDLRATVLSNHVVSGGFVASAVVGAIEGGLATLTTLSGDILPVGIDGEGNVNIGGATVVATDILAGNGVIHLIDSVLVPGP